MIALRALPWGKIAVGLLYAAIAAAIVLYIRNAEKNRTRVAELKTYSESLVQANEQLEKDYKLTISTLEASLKKERQREKDYAKNIEIIRAQEDSDCVHSSPSIMRSLQLRRQRFNPDTD